jgi:hypothetical protein
VSAPEAKRLVAQLRMQLEIAVTKTKEKHALPEQHSAN